MNNLHRGGEPELQMTRSTKLTTLEEAGVCKSFASEASGSCVDQVCRDCKVPLLQPRHLISCDSYGVSFLKKIVRISCHRNNYYADALVSLFVAQLRLMTA